MITNFQLLTDFDQVDEVQAQATAECSPTPAAVASHWWLVAEVEHLRWIFLRFDRNRMHAGVPPSIRLRSGHSYWRIVCTFEHASEISDATMHNANRPSTPNRVYRTNRPMARKIGCHESVYVWLVHSYTLEDRRIAVCHATVFPVLCPSPCVLHCANDWENLWPSSEILRTSCTNAIRDRKMCSWRVR